MDWHELEKMKVSDLREMAKEKAGIEAVSGLHKVELVEKLAAALGIPRPHRVVDEADKAQIKERIRELKVERANALTARDPVQLKRVRRQIHGMKRRLRRMAHLTH